jgi:hypothetical protein
MDILEYFLDKDKNPDDIIELDEEAKKWIDPYNNLEKIRYKDIYFTEDMDDMDYMKHKITYEQYKEKEIKYLQAEEAYELDPFFSNMFYIYAPENSIQFLDIKDKIKVILETSERDITKYIYRNPQTGIIYRKLKERLRIFLKLKNNNKI